jgi:hypothetical protein
MRTSFAVPLKIDYFDTKPFSSPSESLIGVPVDAPPVSSATSRLPDFGDNAEVYAVTSRIAGRINATAISEQERNSLLRERQTLLDKKLSGTITSKEANRLEYVRWSLDRIEDAQHGQTLDALESSVVRYEQFLAEMQELQEQLRQLTKGRK